MTGTSQPAVLEIPIARVRSEPAAPPASLRRTVVAGAVGNVLEWYDFGLFGFFAPVIARQIRTGP